MTRFDANFISYWMLDGWMDVLQGLDDRMLASFFFINLISCFFNLISLGSFGFEFGLNLFQWFYLVLGLGFWIIFVSDGIKHLVRGSLFIKLF